MGRIFISHRNKQADNAWAKKIHDWIKENKGINGFLDFDIQTGLQAGQKWEDEIYAAMNAAQVVIAIISKDWLASDWCLSEARMARLLGRKLIPIVIENCELPFRDVQSIRVTSDDQSRAFEQLRQALRSTYKLPARPFPGLAAFEEKDAAVFFGRETEVLSLESQIDSLFHGRPETARLLLLLGASGSGKSSVMRAGLIPNIKTDPTRYCIKPIVPRGDPLTELEWAIGINLEGLNADAAAVAVLDKIKKLAPESERIVLPIDQAEELLVVDNDHFFALLRAILDKGRGRVLVLMTMRTDFLNAFQQSNLINGDPPLLYDTFMLDPLPENRLPEIIQKPAGLYAVTFEEGLIARIIQDHDGSDALPLLAFFLREFWRKDYILDGVLQLSEYESFGGIGTALKKAVERAIQTCRAVEPDSVNLMEALRDVFIGRLVSVNSLSGNVMRNRAVAATLTQTQVALLGKFAKERLLVEKDGKWEVAHEALLRQWDELRNWVDEARDDLTTMDRIDAAADQWAKNGQENSDLTLSGRRLEEAVRMLRSPRYADRFEKIKQKYIEACQKKENDLYEQEKILRKSAENALDRARASAYTAEVQAKRALKNQRLSLAALSSNELRSGRPAEAVYLAIAACPKYDSLVPGASEHTVAFDSLSAAGAQHRELLRCYAHVTGVYSLTISPDGMRLATTGSDHTARLWDVESGMELFRLEEGHSNFIHSATFSPDGTRLVTAGNDNAVWHWDVATGTQITRFEGHKSHIDCIAFSPDGTCLATAGRDQTARIWSAFTGEETARMKVANSYPHIESIAFSPDGGLLATAGNDDVARVWNVRTGALEAQMDGHDQRVITVAFSPDGVWLASGGTDATARIWDVATGAELARLEGHESWVTSVVFSPDGASLVTVGHDENARLWDVERGTLIRQMWGHDGIINSVVFSQDGRRIVTAGSDGTARLWDVATGDELVRLVGHSEDVDCLELFADGQRIATASQDGTARVWDIAKGVETARLDQPVRLSANEASFSPDGTLLGTVGDNGAALLWDVATGTKMVQLDGHSGVVNSIAFSPDCTVAATGGLDSTVRLWNIATGNQIKLIELKRHDKTLSGANSITFSPDGKVLASVGQDQSVRLWDTQTGAEKRRLTGHEYEVYSIAFSHHGEYLATAGKDRTARIWELVSGTEIMRLDGHEGQVRGVAFSPDSSTLATVSYDETARVWEVATGAQLAQIKGHEGFLLDIAFSPDGTRLATAGNDGTARLWDAATGIQIARLKGHGSHGDKAVHSVDFSADGTHVATAGADGTTRIWNVDYGTGNAVEIFARRLPTRMLPAILETYGIELDDPI